GRRVAGCGVSLHPVEVWLVRDVTHDTGLRTGAEERPLRPLQHFDALEFGGVDVEVTAGQLRVLIVEIDGDVGKGADHARSLQRADGRRQAAHVDVVLAGTQAL